MTRWTWWMQWPTTTLSALPMRSLMTLCTTKRAFTQGMLQLKSNRLNFWDLDFRPVPCNSHFMSLVPNASKCSKIILQAGPNLKMIMLKGRYLNTNNLVDTDQAVCFWKSLTTATTDTGHYSCCSTDICNLLQHQVSQHHRHGESCGAGSGLWYREWTSLLDRQELLGRPMGNGGVRQSICNGITLLFSDKSLL